MVPKIRGTLGAALLAIGCGWPDRNTCLYHLCCRVVFVHSSSHHTSVFKSLKSPNDSISVQPAATCSSPQASSWTRMVVVLLPWLRQQLGTHCELTWLIDWLIDDWLSDELRNPDLHSTTFRRNLKDASVATIPGALSALEALCDYALYKSTLILHYIYINWYLPEKLTPRVTFSRPLKVIRTETDRSATYDFLLVIRSNHGPISYCFRDKRRFLSKIANFPTPCVFNAPFEGVSLGIM